MNTLFIDTHLFDINIIVFKDQKIEYQVLIENKKNNSIYLMPSIKDACDKYEIDEIVIVNGPGSFTSVRLGVTVAKTLAYTMNKPIKVISAFDLMAFSVDEGKHCFAFSDGNGYYVAEYINKKIVDNPFYLNKADFVNYSSENNVKTNVTINYYKVAESFPKLEVENPHGIKPIYVKLIGVEYDKINN